MRHRRDLDALKKEKGRKLLLDPDNTTRQVADRLNRGIRTVCNWRQELEEEGLLPKRGRTP